MAQRFEAGDWATGPSEAPILAGAAVSFDCRRVQVFRVDTRDISLCEVLAVNGHIDPVSLIYLDRSYHVVTARQRLERVPINPSQDTAGRLLLSLTTVILGYFGASSSRFQRRMTDSHWLSLDFL